ncbi:MAG TPA: antibiotic biosynthesis monooxygenase [Nonomuraea sp.]|nr:antibiotic biosynthesis monooxygenase [Nonomuraea sp.]
MPDWPAARRVFAELVDASRRAPGVIDFNILQDPDYPRRFVSIEVYADEAVDRHGELPQLDAVMETFLGLLSAGPDETKFVVSYSVPWPR